MTLGCCWGDIVSIVGWSSVPNIMGCYLINWDAAMRRWLPLIMGLRDEYY